MRTRPPSCLLGREGGRNSRVTAKIAEGDLDGREHGPKRAGGNGGEEEEEGGDGCPPRRGRGFPRAVVITAGRSPRSRVHPRGSVNPRGRYLSADVALLPPVKRTPFSGTPTAIPHVCMHNKSCQLLGQMDGESSSPTIVLYLDHRERIRRLLCPRSVAANSAGRQAAPASVKGRYAWSYPMQKHAIRTP